MSLMKSMQKAIDFLENQLLSDLTIRDIAAQAHMSPYHFQRTFYILTDLTVMDYIRRRRLTKAAHELYNSDAKIIDLAYKYGYDTPESFTKAFRKQHGMSPSQARKGLGSLQSFNRLVIQVHLKGAEPMKYKLIKREAFKAIGFKYSLPCDGEMAPSADIAELWEKAAQNGTVPRLLAMNSGEINGLMGITVDFSQVSNEIEYWIAAENNHDEPDGLSRLVIPASNWAVFEVTGPYNTALPQAWKQIHSEWFPSNDYEHSGAPSIEVYKSADSTSADAKSEIWVPIK